MQKIILYGAGNVGQRDYNFLAEQGLSKAVVAFCDQKADSIDKINGIKVMSYETYAKNLGLPFVITVSENTVAYDEISIKLASDNQIYYKNLDDYLMKVANCDRVKIYRDYCAFFHIESMDKYFTVAESDDALNIFWGNDSNFYKLFKELSLTNVVELACGRGRHVPFYVDKAKEITLVDILAKNIDFCRKRFLEYSHIHYYQNNGYDLSELTDDTYTALFTYDAMVHFELLDIYNYLRETYRILCSGGMALFHHSNYTDDYEVSFMHTANLGGRNFMSKKIFAHLAYRAGLEVVQQDIIDWSEPNIDCITLCRKP